MSEESGERTMDGRTTDGRWSEKLTFSIRSGELKKKECQMLKEGKQTRTGYPLTWSPLCQFYNNDCCMLYIYTLLGRSASGLLYVGFIIYNVQIDSVFPNVYMYKWLCRVETKVMAMSDSQQAGYTLKFSSTFK